MSVLSKIIYLILFAVLLAEPHLVTGHILVFPRPFAQSLLTLIILGLAYGTYWLNAWHLKRRERQLADSFRYIGLVNRRLPLLKNLTTDLIRQAAFSQQERKAVFNQLLATAVTSVARAEWGIFRFIAAPSGRTMREFIHASKKYALEKTQIGNQQLLDSRAQANQIKEIHNLLVISTSDKKSPGQCFLILPKGKQFPGDEFSILQSIVDQTQLFHKYLYPA